LQPCLQLLLLARQRDVKELFLLANVTKGGADVPLEVVPLEAKLFRRHCVVVAAVESLVGKGLYEQAGTNSTITDAAAELVLLYSPK
jgi:hypothetical protein